MSPCGRGTGSQGANKETHFERIRRTTARSRAAEQDCPVCTALLCLFLAFCYLYVLFLHAWIRMCVRLCLCLIIFLSFYRPSVHPYASEYAQTKQYQSDVSNYLAVQKEHVLASVRASERLIQATMQSQYHLFKPKYLLLLEGM